MNRKRSIALYRRALGLIPGGVNSPVRAFKAIGIPPVFIERAKGSKIWDVDGNEYVDYVGSWGPMIMGHAHPRIVRALKKTAPKGTSFGAPTPLEVELAMRVRKAFPSMELMRMVSSGTEAVMSAIRVARGYKGRNKILKFEGCYHGHGDSLLVKAGSGATTFGIPDSLGVPEDLARHTLTAPYNDLEKVKHLVNQYPEQIACIIVEPIAGNMGVILPEKGFLEGLRKICDEKGILFLFDEVITGFRVAYGGAQELYGIKADLTCLGKIIGGGLPVGAYGGKEKIMESVAPLGGVYQAGTLSGNPLAMAAGIETLEILKSRRVYHDLEKKTSYLTERIFESAEEQGVPVSINRATGMFTLFFTGGTVRDYFSAKTSDTKRFAKFFTEMLDQGIYLPPSQFEAWFISLAHTQKDLDKTIEACDTAFKKI
ncbi:MAG: glutamate-1-semialdehyde-2,1-aminomutase [Deltaproteobacteria bacterium RBG_16_49_23]|nr:MAG: glutamate-1-semialdehyde-2,1-aminomutase [Deltaproteobacteria bacterium RBG_16_49_23]